MLVPALALLGVLAVASPAQAYKIGGKPWPGHTIRYYSSLPKAFEPTLKQATGLWNSSGVHVRFVRVSHLTGAQVWIRIGRTLGTPGYASIGRQPHAYVHLAIAARAVRDPEQQPLVLQVLTHELGHVLGLDHSRFYGCQLMSAMQDTIACPQPAKPWLYFCRIIDRDALAGAAHLYGGKGHVGPRFCEREPAPPQLQDVRFEGGEEGGGVVHIAWRTPKNLRRDAHIDVGVYPTYGCGNASARAEHYSLPVTATGWTDENGASKRGPLGQRWCYRLQVITKYERTTEPITKILTAFVFPPAAPVVGAFEEYPADGEGSDYATTIQLPGGGLPLVRYAPSGQCSTDLEAAPQIAPSRSYAAADRYFLRGVPPGAWCLTFYVRKDGKASTPVFREVVHAAPPAALSGR